jgi:hypothetical protein
VTGISFASSTFFIFVLSSGHVQRGDSRLCDGGGCGIGAAGHGPDDLRGHHARQHRVHLPGGSMMKMMMMMMMMMTSVGIMPDSIEYTSLVGPS